MQQSCKGFLIDLINLYGSDNFKDESSTYKSIKEFLEKFLSKFNCYSSKRTEPKPDIICCSRDLKSLLLIEVKKFTSEEFNLEYLKFSRENKKYLILFSKERKRVGSLEDGKNANKDGIGQLKRYYKDCFHKNRDKGIYSILTNGRIWVVFQFLPENEEELKKEEIINVFDLNLQEDCCEFLKFLNGINNGKEIQVFPHIEVIYSK